RVARKRPVASVDEQHLARSEPSAFDAVCGIHAHDTRLRRRGDEPVARALPSQGAEAVAVEGRTDDDPVAERERGGPVPGFESDRLVAIEIADRRGEVAA